MTPTVQVRRVASVPLAVVHRRARQHALSKVVPEACGTVWNALRAQAAKGAGRHVALYLGTEENGELILEIGVEISGPFTPGEVVSSQTPAGIVATAAHIGSYAGLGAAHGAIISHCKSLGLTLAGPNWEIYGHWTDDESKLRTDVYYLLASS